METMGARAVGVGLAALSALKREVSMEGSLRVMRLVVLESWKRFSKEAKLVGYLSV